MASEGLCRTTETIMSIFRCEQCDEYRDADYSGCFEGSKPTELICEDCRDNLAEPETTYATHADLDNYLEKLSDDPVIMDVLKRLGKQ